MWRIMRRTRRKLRQTPIFRNIRASVTTGGETTRGVATLISYSQKATLRGPVGSESRQDVETAIDGQTTPDRRR
jgi:hypothetical protein